MYLEFTKAIDYETAKKALAQKYLPAYPVEPDTYLPCRFFASRDAFLAAHPEARVFDAFASTPYGDGAGGVIDVGGAAGADAGTIITDSDGKSVKLPALKDYAGLTAKSKDTISK